ncbi:hypothetical protein TWF281_003613 [Arthrobotrys megalospora]
MATSSIEMSGLDRESAIGDVTTSPSSMIPAEAIPGYKPATESSVDSSRSKTPLPPLPPKVPYPSGDPSIESNGPKPRITKVGSWVQQMRDKSKPRTPTRTPLRIRPTASPVPVQKAAEAGLQDQLKSDKPPTPPTSPPQLLDPAIVSDTFAPPPLLLDPLEQLFSTPAPIIPDGDGVLDPPTPPQSLQTTTPPQSPPTVPQNLSDIQPQVTESQKSADTSNKSTSIEFNKDDIIIAVMGVTGAGKSTLISLLVQDKNIEIGHGLTSCTSTVGVYSFKHNGSRVFLVDTPGFDDTNRSDSEILKDVAYWLATAYSDEAKLAGIIYLHRISDVRMTGSALRNLRMFIKLCGQDGLGSVVLATTHWKNSQGVSIPEETGQSRVDELVREDGFWGGMLKRGSTVVRHDGSRESALNIVAGLVKRRKRVVLDIQKQLIDQKLNLDDTDAAQALQAELVKERKVFQEKLNDLKEDMDFALKEKDEQWVKQIEEDKKNYEDKIQKTYEETEALRTNLMKITEEKDAQYKELQQQIQEQQQQYERQAKEAEANIARLKTETEKRQEEYERQRQQDAEKAEKAKREYLNTMKEQQEQYEKQAKETEANIIRLRAEAQKRQAEYERQRKLDNENAEKEKKDYLNRMREQQELYEKQAKETEANIVRLQAEAQKRQAEYARQRQEDTERMEREKKEYLATMEENQRRMKLENDEAMRQKLQAEAEKRKEEYHRLRQQDIERAERERNEYLNRMEENQKRMKQENDEAMRQRLQVEAERRQGEYERLRQLDIERAERERREYLSTIQENQRRLKIEKDEALKRKLQAEEEANRRYQQQVAEARARKEEQERLWAEQQEQNKQRYQELREDRQRAEEQALERHRELTKRSWYNPKRYVAGVSRLDRYR